MFEQLETITRTDIKRNNRLRIYNQLREEGESSCPALAKKLGLSLPTVGKNISNLETDLLILSFDGKSDTGGRSPKIYDVVADYRVAIGVNITNRHISAVVCDLRGNIIAHVRYRQKFSRTDAYFKKIAESIDAAIQDANITDEQILGVSLVIPALITKSGDHTYYNGVLRLDPHITCEEFSRYIPYPTRFCHDARSAAYAENWYNHGVSDFFYMMMSDTICGAPILSGGPYPGLNNRSGEIGHMKIVRNGKLCYCGKRGCMDSYCSTKVLSNLTKGDLALFFQLLEEKDEKAIARWNEYLHYLVVTINTVRMLFDCSIVIGGYLGQYIEPYMDDIRSRVLAEDPFCDNADYLSMCVCKKEASATGGALMLIDQFIRTI